VAATAVREERQGNGRPARGRAGGTRERLRALRRRRGHREAQGRLRCGSGCDGARLIPVTLNAAKRPMSPPDSAVTAAIAPLPGVATSPARAPAYRRILLKLSGEALMGSDSYGIERETIDRIVAEVSEVVRLVVQVAIVIGGGNIFRGVAPGAAGMDRATADYMGMLATL